MTKAEFFEMLEELPDNAEITLALQPRYPMSGSIRNICLKVRNGDPIGAVIACSDNEDYGCTRRYWEESEVDVDEDGELIDDED